MLQTVIAIAGFTVIAGLVLRVRRARQHRTNQHESVSEGNNRTEVGSLTLSEEQLQAEHSAADAAHAQSHVPPHSAGLIPAVLVQLDKPSVLLVDDHPLMRQLMTEVLAQVGIGVVSAANSQEALALLGQYQVGMLVSDVQMPGMDGIELLRRLRATGSSNAAIPCVFITGNLDDTKRQEAKRLGALAFFTKPFDIHEIAQFIANELEKERLVVSN